MATPEQTASLRQKYLAGNFGYGHAKQALFEVICERFARERQAFEYLMSHPEELEEKLQRGEKRATEIAREVLNRVKEKLGY